VLSFDDFLRTDELTIGMEISTINGNVVSVAAIEVSSLQAEVYNLTIGEAHTYFVGEDYIWVHNVGPCPEPISVVPSADVQAKLNQLKNSMGEEFEVVFENGGRLTGKVPSNLEDFKELEVALQLAETGKTVKLLGGSGSPGVDLLIGTQRYELATQTQPGSLLGALQRKVNSSTRGAAGSHILIDGRGFTDVAQAKLAIDHAKGLQTFMNNPVPITIFVRGG
jgi:predicted amino acid racemase